MYIVIYNVALTEVSLISVTIHAESRYMTGRTISILRNCRHAVSSRNPYVTLRSFHERSSARVNISIASNGFINVRGYSRRV